MKLKMEKESDIQFEESLSQFAYAHIYVSLLNQSTEWVI